MVAGGGNWGTNTIEVHDHQKNESRKLIVTRFSIKTSEGGGVEVVFGFAGSTVPQ